MNRDIDRDISDVVGLVGLLLVFATGYLTAAWSHTGDLMAHSTPSAAEDKKRLRARYRATRLVLVGSLIVTAAVLALLIPLTWDVVQTLDTEGRFRTLRAGLILVDLLLVSLVIAAAVIIKRLTDKKNSIT